jgi:hypothetical protein
MGNDDRGAFVHFDRIAGELIEADADFPTTDALHRGIRVEGVTAGGEHTERGETKGVTTDGAAAADSQRTDTSSRATQRVANVLSDLCELFRHDVSPHSMIFDERDRVPRRGVGKIGPHPGSAWNPWSSKCRGGFKGGAGAVSSRAGGFSTGTFSFLQGCEQIFTTWP